jgi:hypothetical protein
VCGTASKTFDQGAYIFLIVSHGHAGPIPVKVSIGAPPGFEPNQQGSLQWKSFLLSGVTPPVGYALDERGSGQFIGKP